MGTKDAAVGGAAQERNRAADAAPDGGWGWMVTLGCFMILASLPTMASCFSILFSKFLLDLGTSSTITAGIFNAHLLLWNLVGPLVGPLTQEFGHRVVCMVTAACAALCLMTCAFANSTLSLLIPFALGGMFGGLGSKPCYLVIAKYFSKRRGVATSIIMVGMCTGMFAGPPVIRLLQDAYGFRGATLITSAIILHGFAGAALFHPVEWHMKPPVSTEPPEQENLTSRQSVDVTKNANYLEAPVVKKRLRQLSECSVASLHISSIDITGPATIVDEELDESCASKDPSLNPERSSLCSTLMRVLKAIATDMKILKQPSALIVGLGGVLSTTGYLNFTMTMPFVVQARGYSLQDAAWCVSITGVTNLVSRFLSSALSDLSWFKKRVAYVAGAATFATSIAAFTIATDLFWMRVVCAAWGIGSGMNYSLYTLVMAAVVGRDRLPAILGAASLLQAVGFLTLGPLIGLVRDLSGSYNVALLLMAGMVWLGVIMWMFMPTAIKYERRPTSDNSLP